MKRRFQRVNQIEMHTTHKQTHTVWRSERANSFKSSHRYKMFDNNKNREGLTDNESELKQFANMHYVPFSMLIIYDY